MIRTAALIIASAIFAMAGLLKPAEGASVLDEFSADQIMIMDDMAITSRIFVTRGNVRTEAYMPGLPEPSVTIINGARKVVWVMMPGNMYLERGIDTKEDLSSAAWTDPNLLEPLGRETVDGVECEKYRMKSGAEEIIYYIRASDKTPFRMIGSNGRVRIDWRNVKPGPQPAHLFELPAGARKFGLPGGLKIPGLR